VKHLENIILGGFNYEGIKAKIDFVVNRGNCGDVGLVGRIGRR
jgi:hypothetical protein